MYVHYIPMGTEIVMGFSVTVLTSEAGRSSGYLLRNGPHTVLVDAGPGVVDALQAHVSLDALDAVVITHGHADHCLDVMALAYALRFPEPLNNALPLWVPAEMTGTLHALDDTFAVPTLPDMRRPIEQSFSLHTMDLRNPAPALVAGELELTAFPAMHAVPSAALRFSDGQAVLAFSSDTGPTEGVEAAAANADLFCCEATYLQATDAEISTHGHLTARLAGRTAQRAGAGMLVLTHLSIPDNAEQACADAATEFTGEVTAAVRGGRYSC